MDFQTSIINDNGLTKIHNFVKKIKWFNSEIKNYVCSKTVDFKIYSIYLS